MAQRLVVADSSTLIGLAAAGEFKLLQLLFGTVVVTTAVRDEVLAAPTLPGSAEVVQAQADGWLTIVDAQQIGDSLSALGAGEASVIALALEQDGPCLIAIDDAAARTRAEDHGLSVIGVLGILVAAKQSGYLRQIRPPLERLARHGFRVAPALVSAVLSDAGEA